MIKYKMNLHVKFTVFKSIILIFNNLEIKKKTYTQYTHIYNFAQIKHFKRKKRKFL